MSTYPLRRSGQKAFSLAEVLIALLILSVLSVLMVGAIPSAMVAMKKAENRTRAAMLASSTMEYLRKVKFDEIKTGMDITPLTQYHARSDAGQGAATDFQIQVEAGTAFNGTTPLSDKKAREVKVTVHWKDKQGESIYATRTILFREI